jgi:competence protein ComEC
MMLTSDIEAPDEAAMLQRYPGGLTADVMLMPHHGSKTSSTPFFCKAVGAPVAVIPVGYRSRFGHPKAEVLARYEAMGTAVWRTDRDGAVRIELGGAMPSPAAWRHERRRYWFER